MPTFVLNPGHPSGEFTRTVTVRGESRRLKFTAGTPVDLTATEAVGLVRDVQRGVLLPEGEKAESKPQAEAPRLHPLDDERDENFEPIAPTASRRSWRPVSLDWSKYWRR